MTDNELYCHSRIMIPCMEQLLVKKEIPFKFSMID